jgi:hypothetical protein
MVVPWENEMRATRIEEMLTFENNPQPEDETKRTVIKSLIDFFPIRDPTPRWWTRYVRWYNSGGNFALAWTRLVRDIQTYRPALETHLADFQMLAGEGEEESDYDEGDRLFFLPDFFEDKFERISRKIVVNEWMLHKQHRSTYSPELIIRAAVYQMETSYNTHGTFLDLLNHYVRSTIHDRLNN